MKALRRTHNPKVVVTHDGFSCVTDVGRTGAVDLWSWAVHIPVSGSRRLATAAIGHALSEADALAACEAQVQILVHSYRLAVLP